MKKIDKNLQYTPFPFNLILSSKGAKTSCYLAGLSWHIKTLQNLGEHFIAKYLRRPNENALLSSLQIPLNITLFKSAKIHFMHAKKLSWPMQLKQPIMPGMQIHTQTSEHQTYSSLPHQHCIEVEGNTALYLSLQLPKQ